MRFDWDDFTDAAMGVFMTISMCLGICMMLLVLGWLAWGLFWVVKHS
jgi:hypothetical protein